MLFISSGKMHLGLGIQEVGKMAYYQNVCAQVSFEQNVRDLEEQSANVRFDTCDNDEQTIITQNAIRNLLAPGQETPQGTWTGNGHSGDGVTTPATPSKERRQVAANGGVLSTAEVVSNAYDAAKGAHALVVCTEWDEFK